MGEPYIWDKAAQAQDIFSREIYLEMILGLKPPGQWYEAQLKFCACEGVCIPLDCAE